jgi:hypothetical protein
MTMPDGKCSVCTSIAEWRTAQALGGYARSTLDMVMESHFRQRDLAYSTIPVLQPARQSGFVGAAWREIAPSLIGDDDDCARGQRLKRAEIKWEFEPNEVRYSDEQSFASAAVLARGDYDGDGWEDWVVWRSGGYQQGSLRYFDELLFTRRPGGRVVDISPRLLLGMPSTEDLAKHRSEIAASFGLPEGAEIVLKGTLECDDRPLEIEMRLTLLDGFITGSYRYAHTGKPIPVEGTLGAMRRMELAEYALDEQPNAHFGLEWEVRDGALHVKGYWCEAIQTHDVELAGALPVGKRAGP